jgi:hypothetical protein
MESHYFIFVANTAMSSLTSRRSDFTFSASTQTAAKSNPRGHRGTQGYTEKNKETLWHFSVFLCDLG